jgi:hypothetical protein
MVVVLVAVVVVVVVLVVVVFVEQRILRAALPVVLQAMHTHLLLDFLARPLQFLRFVDILQNFFHIGQLTWPGQPVLVLFLLSLLFSSWFHYYHNRASISRLFRHCCVCRYSGYC